MIRIGITGHQHLGDEPAAAWVRTALDRVLGEHVGELVGVSSLAVGADQVFAELVLDRRGALEAVLPFPEYRERSFARDEDRRAYDRLLDRARVVSLEREGRSDEEAYLHAGREVVARSDVLVAVWDGAPARGLGGTADVVAHARAQGRALIVIDPVRREVTRAGDPAQPASAQTLGDGELDAARKIGDPIVDRVVLEHLAAHGARSLGEVTGALFRTKGLPKDHPLVAACLGALGDVELGDPEIITRGQRLFALFGPEILLVLGTCSLPLAFAAGNGVQAVYRARRLKDDPVRRLYDTAQMIVNVMQVGELARGKLGWRTAVKVRLIHALMRRHVQSEPARPWLDGWGTPINQEDLAGTLLSFSAAALRGLRRMGVKLSKEEADSYIYAWSAVGRLLGVDEALLVGTEKEALRLANHIGRRQICATPEGRALAEQLMTALAKLFLLPGYANSLAHFFLEDTAFGRNIAEVLALPAPDWTKSVIAARAWQKRKLLVLLNVVPGAHRRRSYLARRFVQRMILLRRPRGACPFEIPDDLTRTWRVRRAPAPMDRGRAR